MRHLGQAKHVWWPPRWGGLLPPGSDYSILPHPADPVGRAVEVAVFQQHRFAFYFWAKWALDARQRSRGRPGTVPALVTLDWHQDLCSPAPIEEADIAQVDLTDLDEVGLFAWTRLNPLNDGHILAAAYAGLIGDVYVLCKQEDEWLEELSDTSGAVHRTMVFHSPDDLLRALPREGSLYLDIDLDYFTESEDSMGGGDNVRLVSDNEVLSLLNPAGPLMRAVLPRLAGMTVATEPTWCGGISRSNHLLDLLSDALFSPPLLHPDSDWRPLVARRD